MKKALRLSIVVGARPNFVKVAALFDVLKKRSEFASKIEIRLIHTGQHYDHSLSESFFTDLGIPKPDINLEVGGGTSLQQISRILPGLEKDFQDYRPDFVIVVGDVNSTLAGALCAKSLGIQLVHIEAGLRSFDSRMPEEINRIMTDSITDIYFTTSRVANENLQREGHSAKEIYFVGNTMIDTLKKNIEYLRQPKLWNEYNLKPQGYFILTLHRPSNVDDVDRLQELLTIIRRADDNLPIIFPVHPRTKKQLMSLSSFSLKNLFLLEPLPYLEFIYLVRHSLGVLTDSGGIQEETTWLKVPCLTLRDTTERPETIQYGTNEILGNQLTGLEEKIKRVITGNWKKGEIPELWDGNTSQRIIDHLITKIDH